MDEFGEITAESRITQIGPRFEREYVNYKWIGPPIATVGFFLVDRDWRNLAQGSIVSVGPFRVKILYIDPQGYCEVRRVDRYRLESFARYSWLRAMRLARSIYERLIMTLAIWGLAQWDPSERPNRKWIKRRWME